MSVLVAFLTRAVVVSAAVTFPLLLAAFVEMSVRPEAWSHWTRAGIAVYWLALAVLMVLMVLSLIPDLAKSD